MVAPSSVPAGRVVVLVERWPAAEPPAELPVRRALRPGPRGVLVALLVLATVVGAGAIVPLWTMATPGWWFSLLFTVLIGALVIVLWLAFAGAVAQSAERVRARARWAEASGRIERLAGTVASRTVSTIEDGGVDRFELGVDTPSGRVSALWERPTARSPMLLQTQVPGVGATARVWRIRDADADGPVVVEVQDPSVEVRQRAEN